MEKQKVDVALDEENRIKFITNVNDDVGISVAIDLSTARIVMAKLGSLIKEKEQGK